MKTRILFLDDEPLALQGLQRMLRNMRASWEMAFAESARRALELMDQSPFDIVVSDMLMPDMNGAQFLNEVRRRYPDTVRLILSGHAERDHVLQSVGSAHQYISKPCQPEFLKATLIQISDLAAAFQNNSTLKRILFQLDRIPSVPSLYIDLVETLLKSEVMLDEILPHIIRDLGISALVLKLVNSAFFGAPRQLANAAEAVFQIGLDTFKTLVFSVNAFTPFEATKFRENRFDILWEHSVKVALAAKLIAMAEEASKETVEAAYTSGLLHDLGKYLLLVNFPAECLEAIALAKAKNLLLWRAELEVFGFSHAEVGAFLLRLWGLPQLVVEAVAWHHRPLEAKSKSFCPLTAVHAANAIIVSQMKPEFDISNSSLDTEYLSCLGLMEHRIAWQSVIDKAPAELDPQWYSRAGCSVENEANVTSV